MKNVYLIRIPFATKGAIKNKKKSLKVIGDAIFAFDIENQKIIHEYLELISCNYRMTDKNMIEPTTHYIKKKIRFFRDEFLDPITNHKPEVIEKSWFNELNNKQIEMINKELRSERQIMTIKDQLSLFQGSNVSGAKTNHKASSLVCVDQLYFGCNFANPIKNLYSKKKDKTTNYNIIDSISLQKFIEENETFRDLFKEYNEWYFNDIDAEEYEIEYEIDDYKIKNINQKNPEKLNERILNYLDSYFSGIIISENKKKHSDMLRRFYASSIKKEINNNKIPFCALTVRVKSNLLVNAHIISFAKLVDLNTRESLLMAINPYNVLRIDQNTHKLFDDNEITFDTNGNKISRENKTTSKDFLDIKKLHLETIKILNDNWKYWNHNKCNK